MSSDPINRVYQIKIAGNRFKTSQRLLFLKWDV